LRVKVEPTWVKHFSGAPLHGKLLGVPTKIKPGWQSLSVANTLPYYRNL